MAEQELLAISAFDGWKPISNPALTAAPRDNLTIASFAAAAGKRQDVDAALRAAYGVGLPESGRRVEGENIAIVWAGPSQWLAIGERGSDRSRDLERELKAKLGSLASVVDQSDGRAVLRISGPRARALLAKGVPIDLDARAFKPGHAAITHASHIGVILWQLDEAPTYEVALFRSYATSFAHWLDDAAAEYVSVRG